MVGGGYFGRMQARAWQRIDGANLVGIADSSNDARAELKTLFPDIAIEVDLQTLLVTGGIDLLDVATPPATHADLISPLLGKVSTIVCQKPFCENLGIAQSLVDEADTSGTVLIVHENFRFMPWYRAIRQILALGELGEIRQAHFRMRPGDGSGENAYLGRQPYFRTMERFLMHETGIHWIDVFRFLFGEPESIYADLWQSNPAIDGEDSGIVVLTMKSGVRATFDANRTLDHRAKNHRLTMGEFTLEGSDASLFLDGDGNITIRLSGSNTATAVTYELVDRDFGGDCVFHFQNHVINHLVNGSPLETLASDYLKNIRIEEAAYQSVGSGSKIVLS